MKVLNNNFMIKKICIVLFCVLIFSWRGISAQENGIQDFLNQRLYLWNDASVGSGTSTSYGESPFSLGQKKEDIMFWVDGEILRGEIMMESYAYLQPFVFITTPNVGVLKYPLEIDILKNSESINRVTSFFLPVTEQGKYTVELIDDRGFSVFSQELQIGDKNSSLPKKSLINNAKQDYSLILDDTNNLRKELGLNPLEQSVLLQNISQRKTGDMKEIGYIGHKNPHGNDIFSFVSSSEKKYFKRLGENVSGGRGVSLMEAYKGILNSPAHRYLLLFPAWKKIGMSFVEKDGVGYFVQVFSD